MSFSEDDVTEKLRNVNDPELDEDIVSLEMVNEVEVDGATVLLEIDLPNESMKEELRDDIQSELAKIQGIENLQIEWAGEDASAEMESEMVPGVDNIIAVSSGKGGVGKSTIAVNLACALSEDEDADVGLLDADVYGPNVPRMFGKADPPRVTKDEEIIPPEKDGIKVMSMGYLTGENSPVVWRGAMVHKALTQLLGDVRWGELDYLIVDLPPGTGDAQLTIAQTIPVTGAVIVTTPQPVSLDDSRKGVEMFREANVDVAGIVENMSEFVCPDCDSSHDVFGSGGGEKLAEEFDLPLLGQIPLDPKVRTASDSGKPFVFTDVDSPAKDAMLETADTTEERIQELAKKQLPML
ncbi:MAG: Mrp/NBP35 family ATP-binding protein [Halobacteria archaeon]|nr:Mrp/NBP35 family ATP-binding protein [Halobacteria archaeon]